MADFECLKQVMVRASWTPVRDLLYCLTFCQGKSFLRVSLTLILSLPLGGGTLASGGTRWLKRPIFDHGWMGEKHTRLKTTSDRNFLYVAHSPHHYRPQHSYGKVMFLHMSVILSTGGCVSEHALGQAPPGQTSRADTPQIATAADGTHPTGMHSCWTWIQSLECYSTIDKDVDP